MKINTKNQSLFISLFKSRPYYKSHFKTVPLRIEQKEYLEFTAPTVTEEDYLNYQKYIKRLDELHIRFKGNFKEVRQAIENSDFNDKWTGKYCGMDFNKLLDSTETKRLTAYNKEYCSIFFGPGAPYILYYNGSLKNTDSQYLKAVLNKDTGCRIFYDMRDINNFVAAECWDELMKFIEHFDKIEERLK